MAVKLDIFANVKGTSQVNSLNKGVNKLGREATVAATRMKNLEAAAARSRATFASLGTALKFGVAAGFTAAAVGIGSFIKGTIEAGNLVEKTRIQFNAFFGDAQKGAQAFQVLNEYASSVPFSLDKIIKGSTSLAAISDGPEKLGRQLQLVGNLAATANLSFEEAALQYQKVASAGVGAADLLRDRGVTGLLGFTAGARYSVEESVKVFEEAFLDGGKFSKVSNDLAKTLSGNVSMVTDFYFQIKAAAAEPLFEGLTNQVRQLVGDFKKNDAQLKSLAKTIGTSLANGFKNVGDFVTALVTNFDKLIIVVKSFIALKIIGFIKGIVAQLIIVTTATKGATVGFSALNVAIRANPLGILVTLIQGAVVAWIAFDDEIRSIGSYMADKFNGIVDTAALKIRKFTQAIGFGSDENLEKIKDLELNINSVTSAYTKLSKEAKAAFAGQLEDPSKVRMRNLKTPNIRGDMRSAENEKQEAYMKRMADLQAKSWRENRINIVDNAKARGEAERKALENIKLYREQLSNVGIDAKGIADSISTTWVNGLREGNSLLEITKNTFRNVLNTIAETMLQKSIEYGVEQIFQSLLGNRVSIEKQVTQEKTKQLAIQAAITALGGGGGGGPGAAFSNAFGMAEGGIVPGGAPYTDRVPTMLTPGELVVPRKNFNDVAKGNSSNITNINISGNVDQRSIDQIQAVIAQSSAQVGGANRTYQSNTRGVRGRNR